MWVLPSRGRPQNIARFFAAWRETKASTCGVLVLDWDDCSAYSLIELPDRWRVHVLTRKPLAELQNEVYRMYPDEPWYGLIADDVVPKTKHWDAELIAAAGSRGIAYPFDEINKGAQFTHGVLGGELVREMGFLILPGLHRLYGDNVWTEIGRTRGVLKYLPEVVLEHWHFSNGKAQYDETYRKDDSHGDQAVYERWLGQYRCNLELAVA